VNSIRRSVNSARRSGTGQKHKDQKSVTLPFHFGIFGARFLGDFEDFFTTSTWVSVLYLKVIIFHESMVIFIILFEFNGGIWDFCKNFSKTEIQDLEDDLLLEFDKIGMVELVSEWAFGFRENYIGFREAGPVLTFVDFLNKILSRRFIIRNYFR